MSTSRSSPEAKRLEALRRYDILDTPREEQFDRVTRLAARWFEVPIALITLLDEDRQWFKACVGVDRRETPREVAFCRHHIYDDAVFIVEDATEDPRFDDNPLVTDAPGIRFYAGAPLVTPGGYILGSLCLIDREPRDAATIDRDTLRDLAAIVVDELELRRANASLKERNRQVQELADALTTAEENERERLSTLLHEDLQQTLHSARIKLDGLDLTALSDEQAQGVERAKEWLSEAIDVTRGLSARFAPQIHSQSLPETLDWLATRMQETYGLSVSVEANGPVDRPDETLRTLLFRVVRELLFNVVKHTECTEARIALAAEERRLRLVVEDEGRGFVPETQMESGLGLASIRNRIRALGGTVQVASAPDEGTRVTVDVPVS